MKVKLLLLALFVSFFSSAQILTFDFAGIAGNEASANSNFNNANLSNSTITRGAGLTASGNADRFNAVDWATTSIANAVSGNDYMEFTITPNASYQFNVSSIVFQIQRSGTGLTSVALRSSVDGYATNLDAIKPITDNTTTQTITFTFTQANSSSAVTYRLYGFAEATGGTGGPGDGTGNDIIVNGSVTSSCTAPADPTGSVTVSANPSCGAATLSYSPGFYWQTTATGTSTAFPTTSNYSLASSGTIYVRAYDGVSCWSTGNLSTAPIVINSPSAVSTNPSNVTIANGANTSFSVTGTNVGTYQWQVDTGSGFNDISNGAPYSNVATATLNITGATFAMNGYQYRCVLSNAPCTPATSNVAILTVSAPQPEINIRQAATSIAHNGTQLFATTAIGSSSDLVFTIENTGTFNLTFSTPLSASGDYSIITPLAVSPVTAGSSTTFTVRFTPTAIGTRTGSVTIGSTNDTDEPNYTINFTATATASNLSDIIENTGFTYNSNIDYTAYQAASITNTANSIGVFQFTLRDGGATLTDADALGTELSAITFNVTNIANIRTAALFKANTLISNTPIIGAGTISFSGLSGANVTALDGTQENLTLRITFNTAVTDNQQLQFTIASVTAAAGSSLFATANAGGATSSTTGDRNRIEVIADRLAFVQAPTNVVVSGVMTPSPTVSANDVNGNRDLDFTTATTITSSGTLTGSPVSGSVSSGLITFSGLVHTLAQTGRQLTVISSGLLFNSALSTSFDVTDVANGTYRTLTNGTWPTSGTATWERLISGTWTVATPAASTTDLLIVRHTITTSGAFAASGGVGTKMKIENGGTFNAGHNCTFQSLNIENGGKIVITDPSVDILATTGTVTVDLGGTVTINSATFNLNDGFWVGTENFKNGSTFEILDWDWDQSGVDSDLICSENTISTNLNGYYFGNIILSGTPVGKAFVFVGLIGTHKLCENDLTINNGSNSLSAILTNVAANVEIGGNIIVNTNRFVFGAVGSSTISHIVKGDIIGNGGIIDLNQNSGAGATVFVNLEGNLDIKAPSQLISTDDGCKYVFSKSGIQTISNASSLGLGQRVDFEVASGSTTRLTNQNFPLTNATNNFAVLTGGILEFNYFDLTGSGVFDLNTLGTLRITSSNGVNTTGAIGNVLSTGTRTFSQTGIYHYVGNISPQITGTAMTAGSTSKRIIVDKSNATDVVNLTQSTGTTNELYIVRGVFTETELANISGSGNLTMDTDGKYITSVTSATVPRLSGTYSLNGSSTIELNASENQELRGSRNYRNLTFSTSGTKTISSAISSITGTITVADAAVLNVEDKGMGGIGTNLTMTGTSQYITAGIGVKPDASETYNLGTGTKVTFTSGSIAVPILTLQQIRLAPNYYNIDVLGNNVGTNTATGPVKIQSGGTFTVKSNGVFKHSNTAGFSGSNVTAIDNTNTPTITLEANSTIDYAGADQTITLFSPAYRNLTISGTGVKTLQNDSATRVEEDLKVDAAKLLLTINQILTVKEGVSIAATGAEFELNNNAQLIQIDEVDTNVGTNFKLKRLAFVHAQDYVYWSSPVFGFDVGLIPTQQRYFWNPIFANTNGTVGNWNSATGADAIMPVGKGYIVNCGSGFPNRPLPTGDLETNFVGRPNNGTLTSTIQRGSNALSIDDNWNLVGNPYPSAIFAEEFLDANVTKINGSVWVWTHGQAPDNAIDPYYDNFGANYYATDYLKYNKLGATDTTFNGIIASGQGFMVNMLHATPSTSETVTFTNAMRTDATATPYNNSGFYKTANTNLTVVNPEEKHRIWLSIINTAVGQKESALLGYSANSTLAADHFYDCIYVPRTEVGIYTLVNTGEYVIQGRPLPFVDSDLVPMGVKIVNAGSHTIAIKKVDGLFEGNQGIYLEDTVLGIVHDLKAAPYTFTSEVGVFNSRFIVRYTPSALSNDDFDSLDNNVVVSTQSTDVSIKSANELMSSVIVYDILGRELVRKNNINANDITLPNVSAVNQALIVKITLENGQVVTRKITL